MALKKILPTPDKPKIYQHVQHLNPLGPGQGWLGNSTRWEEAAPPSSFPARTVLSKPVTSTSSSTRIYCCDSRLHATIKSPGRYPPVGR